MSKLNQKTLVITGGTGYIGSSLVHALAKKYKIIVLTRGVSQTAIENVTFHRYEKETDIENVFKNNNVDTVIHLSAKAAYDSSLENVSEFVTSNITFGSLLLEAMTKNGCKNFINASTFWQEFSQNQPVPICFYAATKAAFEKIIDYYTFDSNLSAISLRLFDVYGPNDPRPKVFQQIKKNSENKNQTHLSSGNQLIYLTHIDDVISGITTILESPPAAPGQHLHFDLRGFGHTLKNAVSVFCLIKNISPELLWGKLADRKNQIFNPVLGEQIPNWQPTIDIHEGLKGI